MDLPRNPTRAVRIGSITIGHDSPIAVQSMTNSDTNDVAATVAQINRLAGAGADLVRVAVPRSAMIALGLEVSADRAQAAARAYDRMRQAGATLSPLAGLRA